MVTSALQRSADRQAARLVYRTDEGAVSCELTDFGQTKSCSSNSFSGAGQYYFNARWYDPTLGRFITEDPARDGGNWFAYVGNNPMSRVDPTGLQIGDIPAEYTMQQGIGLLAPGQPISQKGCVVTAWTKIVNAITGNNSVGLNSFGYTTTGVGESSMAKWGSNSMYVNSNGDLNTADFVAAKTGWTIEKTDKNLAETLSALESLKVAVYVTGSGNLVDGNGNHTINITGVPGENGLIPIRGTSDSDSTQPMPRNYSLGPSNAATNTTQITGLTYTLPASQQKAFNDALKSEITKTQQQQAQKVEQ